MCHPPAANTRSSGHSLCCPTRTCSTLKAADGIWQVQHANTHGISHLPAAHEDLQSRTGASNAAFMHQCRLRPQQPCLCLAGTVIGQTAVRAHRKGEDSVGQWVADPEQGDCDGQSLRAGSRSEVALCMHRGAKAVMQRKRSGNSRSGTVKHE